MTEYELRRAFDRAKSMLDIKAVAERCGIHIGRYGRALCPFHNDTHPSMGFKNNRFKCFACGAGGDVFDLAGKLLGLDKPFEILARLNGDFCLGLDLSDTPDPEKRKAAEKAQQRFDRTRELQQQFDRWIRDAENGLSKYIRNMRYWAYYYAPASPEEEPHPLFLESMRELSYAEYVWSCLWKGGEEEQRSLYINCRSYIRRVLKRVSEL